MLSTEAIYNIIFITIFLGLCLLLYKRGEVGRLKYIVLYFVVQAEKALGSGTGELKYAMVINSIYQYLPSILRFLFTEKELDSLIEEAVKKLKNALSNGATLLSIAEEAIVEGDIDAKC